MFKNIASPIVVGALRGVTVGLLVALATFGTLYGAGATSHAIVAGVIGAAIPVWLGFLGYGAYDKSRADAAAAGDLNAVHASDVKPPATVVPAVAPVVAPAPSNVAPSTSSGLGDSQFLTDDYKAETPYNKLNR